MSDSEDDVFSVLQNGRKKTRKSKVKQLDSKSIKTLLNVIMNVVKNPEINERISRKQRKMLEPYSSIIARLVDKKVDLKKKVKILKKSGHKYLPTFLSIIGEDLDDCAPKSPNRTRRDCPLCDAIDLKRLPLHLSHKHGLSGEEKREWLRKT